MRELIQKYRKKWIDIIAIACILIGGLGLFVALGNNSSGSEKIHLLCIGVDKFVPMGERVEISNSIGQADGIFLISIDSKTKFVDIVSIPRDTMVTIEKYYSDMEYIGTEKAQICLQYAYADGLENSCELMVDRVEELFDGIEIDGYVAMNMTSVLALNDAIGGVTVTIEEELIANALGVELGSEVTLTSEGLEYYIRPREKQESEGAYDRTLRYKEYVTEFIPQGIEAIKKDPGLIVTMLEILKENMVTDLSVTDMVELSSQLVGLEMENITYTTLEGTVVMGANGWEEFYPDVIKLAILRKRIS